MTNFNIRKLKRLFQTSKTAEQSVDALYQISKYITSEHLRGTIIYDFVKVNNYLIIDIASVISKQSELAILSLYNFNKLEKRNSKLGINFWEMLELKHGIIYKIVNNCPIVFKKGNIKAERLIEHHKDNKKVKIVP